MCLNCDTYRIFERAVDEYGLSQAVADSMREILDTYNTAWTDASNTAVDNAVKALRDAPDVDAGIVAMLASLERDLGPGIVTAEQRLVLQTITRDAYSATKARFASGLGTGTGDMTELDIRLSRKLADDGPYWIGNVYDRQLSRRIAEVSNDAILNQGLGRVDAAKVMDEVLRQEFALHGGKSIYAAEVPAQFAGNLDQYNRILTSNVASRVRNFGHLTAMNDAAVERFRFVAVMDERTSEVCQEMDGREFTVRTAMARLELIAESDDPEVFKTMAPWPRNADQIKDIAGKGSFAEQNARLEASNFTFPPLHGECRSVVEQVI